MNSVPKSEQNFKKQRGRPPKGNLGLGSIYGKREDQKRRVEQHSFLGIGWFAALLFALGYLHLTLWRSEFALLWWAHYPGRAFQSPGTLI